MPQKRKKEDAGCFSGAPPVIRVSLPLSFPPLHPSACEGGHGRVRGALLRDLGVASDERSQRGLHQKGR